MTATTRRWPACSLTDICRTNDPTEDEAAEDRYAIGPMNMLTLDQVARFFKLAEEEDIRGNPARTLARDGVTVNSLLNSTPRGADPFTGKPTWDNLCASRDRHPVITEEEKKTLQLQLQGQSMGHGAVVHVAGSSDAC